MEEKLYFKNSAGYNLCGILTKPEVEKNTPILVLCHGFNSSKESNTYQLLSKKLSEKNISSFRFDFFAHGESEGNFEELTASQAIDDILCAINYMNGLGYEKIGLVGSSFGGHASFHAASKTDKLCILMQKAPVSDFKELPRYMDTKFINDWRNTGYRTLEGKKLKYSFFEDTIKNSAYDVAGKILVPTYIVHGDQDEDVPVEQSIKMSKLIKNCELDVVKGADHRFTKEEDFSEMVNSLCSFAVKSFR